MTHDFWAGVLSTIGIEMILVGSVAAIIAAGDVRWHRARRREWKPGPPFRSEPPR